MTETDPREELARLERDDETLPSTDADRDAREMRRRALWQEHGERWMLEDLGFGPSTESSRSAVYRGGQPYSVELPLADALERADRLAAQPLHTLCLTALDGRLLSLVETGALRKLKGLELGYGLEKLTAEQLDRLFRSGHLDSLEELTLSPHQDAPLVWGALGSFPRLGALKKLALANVRVSPERARWLGRALSSLEALGCDVALTGPSLQALCDAAVFSLRELSLMDSDGLHGRPVLMGDEAIARSLSAPALAGLTRLSLFGCHLRDRAADVLRSVPCGNTLVSLDLGSQGAPQVVRALGHCEFPRLERLSIRQNALGDFDLDVLGRLPTLEALRLEKNALTARGVSTVVQRLARLRELDLTDSDIGDDGALVLAARAPATLRSLRVSNVHMTARGASALASSPRLAQLRQLSVSLNDLGKPAVKALADSHLDRMARLSVEYTMKGDPAPLFEDAWLPVREPLAGRSTYERRLELSGAPVARGSTPKARPGKPSRPVRELDPHATYQVGERVNHPDHGQGEITQVSALFVEAKYPSAGKVKTPLVPAGAVPYDRSRRYEAGQIVLHPKLGAGIVLGSRDDRMEVDFGTGGTRTLLQGKA